MSNDEINKYIHTEIMGKCWHLLRGGENPCVNCGMTLNYGLGLYNEDYCSDESPRRLLNEPFARLMQELGEGAFGQLLVQSDAFNSFTANGVGLGIWMTADAETLARFCVEAHKALKEAR